MMNRSGWIDINTLFRAILEPENLKDWEISLTLCHDPYIKELNARYRDKDEATDVLSFCQNEGEEIISIPGEQIPAGDIIISMDTLHRHADEFKVSPGEELRRVTIHGILHLKGMTHETRDPGEKMLVRQEQILNETESIGDFLK